MTTLFCYLPEMNRFTVTNIRDQALSTPAFYNNYMYMANTGLRREFLQQWGSCEPQENFLYE